MNPLTVLRAPRLAARASHEVRGPLTVALLALEGMVARAEVDPDGAQALEHQLARARLAVEDLTAAASGERAPDRLAVLEAPLLVARIALEWRHTDLRVTGDCPDGLVLVDPTRIAQAAGNLLANAFEHGAAPVELRARAAGGHLRLEVRDGGPGLAAPIGTLTRRPRGSRGHGLAIAADIARRHGGRLLAAPTGGGAALVLELPLREVGP